MYRWPVTCYGLKILAAGCLFVLGAILLSPVALFFKLREATRPLWDDMDHHRDLFSKEL